MNPTLVALFDAEVAATVTRLQGGRLRLEYDTEYRAKPDVTPLSVSMPSQVSSHPDRVVTPWLWGLLPDNEAVLDRWARHFQTSAASPFTLLGTAVGHDCPGAVRFVAADEISNHLTRRGTVTWLSEDEVAARLRELRRDSTAWLGERFNGQFSLAGAQAKTALRLEDGRWGVPAGSIATTHILKPAVAGLDDHDLNEHLCMDAARRVGLIVARTRIVRFRDISAIVIERYDRLVREGRLTRVHQEDLCQALGVHPLHKYERDGGPGVRDIGALLRQVMSPSIVDDDVSRFADALIWNWLIGGTDAHAKNYSLLLSGGEVRLAPLYDVASALPYGGHEKELRFAMKIGRDYRVYPYRDPWPTVAAELGINPSALRERVFAIADQTPDAFRDTAQSSDVATLGRPLTARLADRIADRVSRCLRLMSRAPGPYAELV